MEGRCEAHDGGPNFFKKALWGHFDGALGCSNASGVRYTSLDTAEITTCVTAVDAFVLDLTCHGLVASQG
jgi:hypothetical protein